MLLMSHGREVSQYAVHESARATEDSLMRTRRWLTRLSQCRAASPPPKCQRAQMLLRYERRGDDLGHCARRCRTNRPEVERCVSKALELGVPQGLSDLPGRGRRRADG